jgi:hypothetical protein
MGFIGTLKNASTDICQTFVLQDDQTRQAVLKVPILALIAKEISKSLSMGFDDRCSGDDRQLHG